MHRMNYYYLWTLFKVVALTFVPIPVRPVLKRPDLSKNFWTFECEGFTSCYDLAKTFYLETPVAKKLA